MKTYLSIILWIYRKDLNFPFYPTPTIYHSIEVPEPYQADDEPIEWEATRWQ